MTSARDTEGVTERLTITRSGSRPGEASWFWPSLLFHAGLMLFALTITRIPAEGDPVGWWLVMPFATTLITAAVGWLARDSRTGFRVLAGGLGGSLGLLLLMFCFAALTMTS